MGSIPGLEKSPGRGNGNPFQNSCLGNSKDRGALQATVHGVTKNLTQLSAHAHADISCYVTPSLTPPHAHADVSPYVTPSLTPPHAVRHFWSLLPQLVV